MAEVKIPSQAVSADGADLCPPVRGLLEGLDLLGTKRENEQANGLVSVFTGPPQSVALIEAGATAASKWWAAGLSAALIPLWGAVAGWWGEQTEKVQVVALGGAFVVTAALVLAIGYLIASDVRGRAAASIAVINARASVATSMVDAARQLYTPPAPEPPDVFTLPVGLRARIRDEKDDVVQKGWRVLAMERQADGSMHYHLAKGSAHVTLPAANVWFS